MDFWVSLEISAHGNQYLIYIYSDLEIIFEFIQAYLYAFKFQNSPIITPLWPILRPIQKYIISTSKRKCIWKMRQASLCGSRYGEGFINYICILLYPSLYKMHVIAEFCYDSYRKDASHYSNVWSLTVHLPRTFILLFLEPKLIFFVKMPEIRRD